jgi:hypothetical protein
MPESFMDLNAPSLQGGPKKPEDLPHGLIAPPDLVRQTVAQEKAKFPPEIYTPGVEERYLNRYTLQYYFDYLGYEVLYRSTPEGPEVLAVGDAEILAFEKGMSLEEQLKLNTWLP